MASRVEEQITETIPAHPTGGASAPTRGVTPPSSEGGLGRFVSDVIVELGFVDVATVEEAVESGRVTGKSVTSLLLENRSLTEEQLARAIAERHGLNHLDLDQLAVDLGAANLISRSDALRYRAIPVAFTDEGALVVAMADPADPLAIGEISVMTKLEVRPAVATSAGIESLLRRLPVVDDNRESAQAPLHANPDRDANEATSNSQSSADAPGGAVVWQGQETASADGSRPPGATEVRRELEEAPLERGRESDEHRRKMAELGATLARQRMADAEERDGSPELEALRSQLQGLAGAAPQLELAQRETRELHDKLKSREQELTRAREERDRLAAEREAAEEMATAGERAQLELKRLTAEMESAKELASEAEDQLGAALEQERSERAADRERHEREASASRDELERAQAAATAAQESLETERERLLTELETAQARADKAERVAQEAQGAVGEAKQAAEDSARRAAHLAEADDRAERARLALADLRQEREREGELFARTERELRKEVTAERDAHGRQADKLRATRATLSDSIKTMTALEAELAQDGDPQPATTPDEAGTAGDGPQAGHASESPTPGEPPSAGRSKPPID